MSGWVPGCGSSGVEGGFVSLEVVRNQICVCSVKKDFEILYVCKGERSYNGPFRNVLSVGNVSNDLCVPYRVSFVSYL